MCPELFKRIFDTAQQIETTSERLEEVFGKTNKIAENVVIPMDVTKFIQAVHAHETQNGTHPGDIIKIFKNGTILKEEFMDDPTLCKLDGLFQRDDKTWVVCITKPYLTLDGVDAAYETVKRFEDYMRKF